MQSTPIRERVKRVGFALKTMHDALLKTISAQALHASISGMDSIE